MRLTKIIITLILFSVLTFNCFSQSSTIVWKNLQEHYESFEDIKPIIVNESDKPIPVGYDIKLSIVYRYINLLNFSEEKGIWWMNIRHGHPVDKKSKKMFVSESPKFEIVKEQKSFFERQTFKGKSQ